MPAQARFQFRMDTTQNWANANPILLRGEMGIEITAQGQHLFKIGDGIANAAGVVSGTKWLDLPYSSGPQGTPPPHKWAGTNLSFQNPNGTWGDSVNLVGPRGAKGDTGPEGKQGPAGPPYVLPPATITKLGGIKVGKNLTITVDGCLSAPDPFYVPMLGVIMYRGGIGGSDGRRPVYWDGTVNEDWVLCDGITTNGIPVPDLRDKFIVGAGHLYPILSEGGALSHTHEMFKKDYGNKPTQSRYIFAWDTRNTKTQLLRKQYMPQHTHLINGDWGYLPVGEGPVWGNAVAFAVHESAVVTDWNGITGYKRIETAQTPRYSHAYDDDTSSSYWPPVGAGGDNGTLHNDTFGYNHCHGMHPQPTEPATSLPPYYSLIYLMRIH